MLFGAYVHVRDQNLRRPRLRMQRRRPQWPSLMWMIGVLYSHNITVTLSRRDIAKSRLRFETERMPIAVDAMRRWYGTLSIDGCGRARTPQDLRFDENAAAVLLVDALVRSRPSYPVYAGFPACTEALAERMIGVIRDLIPGITTKHEPSYRCEERRTTIVFHAEHREPIQEWVSTMADPAAFTAME